MPWKPQSLSRRFAILAKDQNVTVPRVYVSPPIVCVAPEAPAEYEPGDEQIFAGLSPAELTRTWCELFAQYNVALSDFKALERARVATELDLVAERRKVEALESEVTGEEKPPPRRPRRGCRRARANK
jgi:hypothetical protein